LTICTLDNTIDRQAMEGLGEEEAKDDRQETKKAKIESNIE
jgi:hypothetical protein